METQLPIYYILWGIFSIFLAYAVGGVVTWFSLQEAVRERKSLIIKYDMVQRDNINLQRRVLELESQLKIALARIDQLCAEIKSGC